MLTSFWSGKKVLVTGHTGFKGSWLSLWLLSKGACVYGYSLSPTDEKSLFDSLNLKEYARNENLTFNDFRGDIRDRSLLQKTIETIKPDLVFHLAAQPLVRESYKAPIYTWETNVIGTLNLLNSLSISEKKCALLIISTDKVYENKEWKYGYREIDTLGGHDPYSASKAAMEIAVESWKKSFCGNKAHQNMFLSIATARAGNVIGGGDWATDRIIPDIIRGYMNNKNIHIRNPKSTRPWQHVLDPLNGYLILAEKLYKHNDISKEEIASSFNFGPSINSNISVEVLVENIKKHIQINSYLLNANQEEHESNFLYLSSEKARHLLGWKSMLNLQQALAITINWYKIYLEKDNAIECCLKDIAYFEGITNG